MKKIYLCHQFYTPSHFKAIYECAADYGYRVAAYIVLNPMSAVSYRQKLIEQKGLNAADEWYQNNFRNIGNLWLLKDEIVIIGVAPYDRLLAQYQKVLARNHSIYLTSHTDWHSGNVPYPYKDNKAGFMETLMRDINGVACVSQKTEREVSCYNQNTQVVNHAIIVDRYLKKKDFVRKKKYIFLGRFVAEKNIEAIIDYLKENPQKDISIDLAGDGGGGEIEKQLTGYAERDNRLHLLGFLSAETIQKSLHEYDYLILPSHKEPFGIVLLEAMAAGVPCIVSDAAGPVEIIRHGKTGIIFDLKEKNGFGRAMDYSMELSNEQYQRMSNNAVLESYRYDVSEIIKKWIALFNG